MVLGVIEICKVENTPDKKMEIEWRIDDFFSVFEEDDYYESFCQSPTFAYADSSWSFRLWPNSPNKFMKVTFWTALEPEVSVHYIIGLKNHNGRVERKIYGSIDTDERHSGRFFIIRRTDLEHRKDKYAPGNVLTISCTLKLQTENSTSTQSISSEPIKTKSLELINTFERIRFRSPRTKNQRKQSDFNFTFQKEADASTQTEQDLHANKLLQALKEMLISTKHSDFILNVKGEEIKVHKIILEAHSPVFAAMMEHDTKEKATGIVNIDDFEPFVIKIFVDFLYTGRVDNLNSDNILYLYEAADKYQVTQLSDICLKYVTNNISTENFCDILTLSLRHHERNLTEAATQFFLQNSKEIALTAKWVTFLSENPVAGNELFLKLLNLKE